MGPNKESVTSLTSVDWSTLPAPLDDGAVDHLEGLNLPSLSLACSTPRSQR